MIQRKRITMPNRKINHLHPSVADKCVTLMSLCKAKGINIIVTSTLRTAAEQRALYAQGRMPLDVVNALRKDADLVPLTERYGSRKVTWTRTSLHQFGCAFDIAIVKDQKAIWDLKADVNANDIHDYEEIGALGESIGLRWGGRFGRRDLVHFEYTDGLGIEDLKAGIRPDEKSAHTTYKGGESMQLDGIGKKFGVFLKNVAISVLFLPETKKAVIEKLNEKVNIPILNEKQELELFELVYETVEAVFLEQMQKDAG
jgi:peptidoglycan L-alanyl-D-glutamate endopeptidase CwlK